MREKKERKRIRGAFVKRENFRIITEKTEVQNKSMQEAEARKSEEDSNCTMTDNEINKGSEGFSKSKEAFSQTKRSWNKRSKSSQTKSKASTKGTQINMYPARRSVGIQCNINDNEQSMSDQFLRYEDDMPTESSDLKISSDSEYQEHPESDDSMEYSSEENEKPNAREEKKFIVFQSQLMKLFHTCSKCKSPVVGKIKQIKGSFISVEVECILCNLKSTWNSQPYIGEVPAGNLLISTSIVLSGSIPSKALRMFEFMNVQAPKLSTFYNHQKCYIHPGIFHIWKNFTNSYVEYVKQQGNPLALGGDGRADSPGHSAKYGAYSVIDLDEGLIVHIELVQSNEVKSSSHMELEGLIRTMAYFCDMEVEIGTLVTDRHVQVNKWVRENLPNTRHEFDV
ncbi:uncharacterized protein LOC134253565 [Saccostrea cucullata]|uniref:uncharacterized protein LOC134253565 n=1 Tax=Saccostrea cuccullata TaxID=36930 RepID=UPI002ED314DA